MAHRSPYTLLSVLLAVYSLCVFAPSEVNAQSPETPKPADAAHGEDERDPGATDETRINRDAGARETAKTRSRHVMTRFRPLLHRDLLIYRPQVHDPSGDAAMDHSVRAMLASPIYHDETLSLDVLLEFQFDEHRGPLAGAVLGDGTDEDTLSLYTFDFTIPLQIGLTDTWALELGARISYKGDLESHDPASWEPFGHVMATWRFEPDWAFLFGLVSTEIEEIWLAIPVLGLYYRPVGGPFHFDAFVDRIEARWWAFQDVPTLHFFVGGYFAPFNWHVRERGDIERYRIDAFTGVRWGIWGPLELDFRVGSNLYQFTTWTPDVDERVDRSFESGPTFAFSTGIVVRTEPDEYRTGP